MAQNRCCWVDMMSRKHSDERSRRAIGHLPLPLAADWGELLVRLTLRQLNGRDDCGRAQTFAVSCDRSS